jgi:hypothetical protein
VGSGSVDPNGMALLRRGIPINFVQVPAHVPITWIYLEHDAAFASDQIDEQREPLLTHGLIRSRNVSSISNVGIGSVGPRLGRHRAVLQRTAP